jgi:hypothetical protein
MPSVDLSEVEVEGKGDACVVEADALAAGPVSDWVVLVTD